MYNLLIVDDEPLITDSLYDLFAARAETEYNIMKAYSGREALGWMDRTRIDILLTDISMPDVTGFDVHRQMALKWPECLVIYLTSFDEFEFVQQAIRNEGVDYILKTEGDQAVIDAVDKAAARIEERRNDRLLLQQARDSLSQALPLLQARFVSDLADGVFSPSDDLGAQLGNLRIPLRADRDVLIVLGRAEDSQSGTATDRIRQVHAARNMMDAFFAESAARICTIHDRNQLITLMQPLPGPAGLPDGERYRELARSLSLRVSGSLDRLQSLCGESCGLGLSFAASGDPVPWKDVGAVCYALQRKLREGAGTLYVGSGGQLRHGDAGPYREARAQIARLGLLKSRLEAGDGAGFMELYDAVMASAGVQDAPSYEIRAEIYYRMASMLLEYVNRWGGEDLDRPDVGKLVNMEGHRSWEEAVSFFRGVAERLFTRRQNESQRNESRVFSFIREYTGKNLGGDLSLTHFATLLSFHPFYLSKLFKKITGKTLSEYVSSVKLERAKELLGGGSEKVSDISSSLGFMTSSYFISFFRKHTGLSPLEYRNAAGGRTGS